jgi:CRP-like cAMP-binding protein/FixJ family two-component response regulator
MKKILVIEDSLDVQENIQELLELSGYEVSVADNGKDGKEKAILEQPDLILCDVMMPILDGFRVLRILSKNPKTADIPFIFLTAKVEIADMRKGMNLGADDYIMKPFDDIELLDAIELRLKKSERLKKSFDKDSSQGVMPFFKEVKEYEGFEKLTENKEIRRYRKRDILFEENEYPKQLFFINQGRIKTYKSNSFGKELIIEIFKKGDFLGFIPLIQEGRYTESAAAMEDCEIAIIPKVEFFTLLRSNTNVTAQLIKMLANNVVEKETQLLSIAYDSVRRKVADALLQLATDYDKNGHAEFSILREDLANMVGTAKETVIRTLSEFKEDGLINLKGSRVTILDKEELMDMPY